MLAQNIEFKPQYLYSLDKIERAMTTEELIEGKVDFSKAANSNKEEQPNAIEEAPTAHSQEDKTNLDDSDEHQEVKSKTFVMRMIYTTFFIGAITGGFVSLIGLVAAHFHRKKSNKLDASHCKYMQRTICFSFLWLMVSVLVVAISTTPFVSALLGAEMVAVATGVTGIHPIQGMTILAVSLMIPFILVWQMYRTIKGAIHFEKKKNMYE
ncbi:membrane hypothetical protein [Vibrio chagasii]|nr:membrane hypothetical protein [Vibrio chagasii]